MANLDVGAASDGELQAVAAAIEAEVRRRESEDYTARVARFQAELSEVKQGTRPAYAEHLRYLSPSETTALVEGGMLAHLGVGRSKRRGQR